MPDGWFREASWIIIFHLNTRLGIYYMRVGQRLWWARRPICQTSVGFSTMKGSIVSRQIDRPVYYNVLPRDASRAPTNAGGTIPSGTPCKFLWSSRVQRVRVERGTLEGYRAPNSIFFFAFPSRADFPSIASNSGSWSPPSQIFFSFWKMSLHPRLFSMFVSPPAFLPTCTSNVGSLSLVVPPPFPSGEDRWYLPPSANFYFPASGVLKITLRPCLCPPHPWQIAVVVDRTGGGTSLRVKGWFPLPGCTLKKAQEEKECRYKGEKCQRHMNEWETKIVREDPWVLPFSLPLPPPLRFSFRRSLY